LFGLEEGVSPAVIIMESKVENQMDKPRWRICVPIFIGVLCAFCNWTFLRFAAELSINYYGVRSHQERLNMVQEHLWAGLASGIFTLLLVLPLSIWAIPSFRKGVLLALALWLLFAAGIFHALWYGYNYQTSEKFML
jgi:hypothetical protein